MQNPPIPIHPICLHMTFILIKNIERIIGLVLPPFLLNRCDAQRGSQPRRCNGKTSSKAAEAEADSQVSMVPYSAFIHTLAQIL